MTIITATSTATTGFDLLNLQGSSYQTRLLVLELVEPMHQDIWMAQIQPSSGKSLTGPHVLTLVEVHAIIVRISRSHYAATTTTSNS